MRARAASRVNVRRFSLNACATLQSGRSWKTGVAVCLAPIQRLYMAAGSSTVERFTHHFGEGVYQFWITPADLRARRFDKVELTADAY